MEEQSRETLAEEAKESVMESLPKVEANGDAPPESYVRPFFFKYLPKAVRYDDAQNEATGVALDLIVRATLVVCPVFIGPVLLILAHKQAVSDCKAAGNIHCADAKIYGVKPSSLLTLMATIGGLGGAITLPIAGSIVDHTRFRRMVGILSAIVMIAVKGVELHLSYNNWFVVLCLNGVTLVAYQYHLTATYAYSSELSRNPKKQSNFQSYFVMLFFCSSVIYMILVLFPSQARHLDPIMIGRLAAWLAVVPCVLFFPPVWLYLFSPRPPLRTVPQGQNLLTTGFLQLYRTFNIVRKELPAVKWMLLGNAFIEAADATLPTIATTFMSQYLFLNSLQIGTVILLSLIGGAFGSRFGNAISFRTNPITSAKINTVFYTFTTVLAMLTSKAAKGQIMYLYGIMWGISIGWMNPQLSTLFISITPKGQNVELMGIYMCSRYLLYCLPPFIFTVFNEAGLAMNWALSSVLIFFVIGFIFLSFIGDYDDARRRVGNIDPHEETKNSLDEETPEELVKVDHNTSTIGKEETQEMADSSGGDAECSA